MTAEIPPTKGSEHERAGGDNTASKPEPPAVSGGGIRTPHPADKAKRRKRKRPHDCFEWAGLIFSGVICLATIAATVFAAIAAYVFWCQLRAMQDANSDSRYALIQSQRAWVFPKFVTKNILTAQNIPFQVTISPDTENSGNTPAFNAGCWVDQGRTDNGFSKGASKAMHLAAIAPHGQMSCATIGIPNATLGEIWSHERRVFIWVLVEYRDAFEKTPPRYTEVCAEVKVEQDPNLPVMAPADKAEVIRFQVASPRCNRAD